MPPFILTSALPAIECPLIAQSTRLLSLPFRPSPITPRCTDTTPHQRTRAFTTALRCNDWLAPRGGETRKSPKGRARVPTGGSTRGTTLVWGDYGLRLIGHDRRISAAQLKLAHETIRRRLRGEKYALYHRVAANIGVCVKGNDQRMGKGKGSFDHWACRVPVSKVVFEVKGSASLHEVAVRDAMRLAGHKLPGTWEFVRKGDPPVMGRTKVTDRETETMLRRPRLAPAMPHPNMAETARRIPGTTPG